MHIHDENRFVRFLDTNSKNNNTHGCDSRYIREGLRKSKIKYSNLETNLKSKELSNKSIETKDDLIAIKINATSNYLKQLFLYDSLIIVLSFALVMSSFDAYFNIYDSVRDFVPFNSNSIHFALYFLSGFSFIIHDIKLFRDTTRYNCKAFLLYNNGGSNNANLLLLIATGILTIKNIFIFAGGSFEKIDLFAMIYFMFGVIASRIFFHMSINKFYNEFQKTIINIDNHQRKYIYKQQYIREKVDTSDNIKPLKNKISFNLRRRSRQ